MRGPTDDFRSYVWAQAQNITTEDALTALLGEIEAALRDDLEPGYPPPGAAGGPPASGVQIEENLSYVETQIAAAESWASLATYAVARVSAPASPRPRNVAGWGLRRWDGYVALPTRCRWRCDPSRQRSAPSPSPSA